MKLCQCTICLRERARVIVELQKRGIFEWWYHNDTINRAAELACEKARAEGYVDPPHPFARGIPMA